MTEYNGWANRETWTVWVWISGNKDLYQYARLRARNGGGPAIEATITSQATRSLLGLTLDLMTIALSRVDWYAIGKALLEEKEPEMIYADLTRRPLTSGK